MPPSEEGLSTVTIAVICLVGMMALLVCISSAAVYVRARGDELPVEKQPAGMKTLLRCAEATYGMTPARKRKKISRVEPMPEMAANSQNDPLATRADEIGQLPLTAENLQFSAVAQGTAFPALQWNEQQVQPAAEPHQLLRPDVSSVSRQQKEAVMNRRRSLTPPKTTSAKLTPRPSFGSDQSTRSPSPVPSSARSKHSNVQSNHATPRATPRQDFAAFNGNSGNAWVQSKATTPRTTPQATPRATSRTPPRTTPRTTPRTLPHPCLQQLQQRQKMPHSPSIP